MSCMGGKVIKVASVRFSGDPEAIGKAECLSVTDRGSGFTGKLSESGN